MVITEDLYYALFALFSPGIGPVKGREILETKNYDRLSLHNDQIKKRVDHEIEHLDRSPFKLVSIRDEAYPFILKKIHDAPILLYYEGNLNFECTIGIIGSRNVTSYGEKITEHLSSELLSYGNIDLVSGFALGIDSIVHRACVKEKKRTIAVLGCGLDIPYPRLNMELREEILTYGGTILTEFPLETQVRPENFARRNRILSGISLALIVTQAALKSGTMITSRYASEQGREIFSVPAPLFQEEFKGNHYLIKTGAYLIENAKEIIEILVDKGLYSLTENEQKITEAVNASKNFDIPLAHLSQDEQFLYRLLDHEKGRNIDFLFNESQFSSSKIFVLLSKLEMEGYIEQKGSAYFRK